MGPIKTLDGMQGAGEDGESRKSGEDISFIREARAMGWLSKFFNSGKVEVSVDPALRERLRAQWAAAGGGGGVERAGGGGGWGGGRGGGGSGVGGGGGGGGCRSGIGRCWGRCFRRGAG